MIHAPECYFLISSGVSHSKSQAGQGGSRAQVAGQVRASAVVEITGDETETIEIEDAIQLRGHLFHYLPLRSTP